MSLIGSCPGEALARRYLPRLRKGRRVFCLLFVVFFVTLFCRLGGEMSDDGQEGFLFGHVLLHQEFGRRFLYAGLGKEADGLFVPLNQVLVPQWSVLSVVRRSFVERRMRLKGPHCSVGADVEVPRYLKRDSVQGVSVNAVAAAFPEFSRVLVVAASDLGVSPLHLIGRPVMFAGQQRVVTTVVVFPMHLAFGLQGGTERGIDFSPFAEGDDIPRWRVDTGTEYQVSSVGITW